MSATRIELRADYFQGWLAEARFYVNVGAGCHGNGISLKKNALTCLFHTCTHKQLLLTLVIIIIVPPSFLPSDHQQSLLHSLMVLSFSSAAEAMMFSVGWHAVQRTTSVWPSSFCTISFVCRFQMYTCADRDSMCVRVFQTN